MAAAARRPGHAFPTAFVLPMNALQVVWAPRGLVTSALVALGRSACSSASKFSCAQKHAPLHLASSQRWG
eukprot:5759279-Pleurochrysis_carterae.AAC.1